MNPNQFLEEQYRLSVIGPTDIHKHLPLLRDLAQRCKTVVELGVRDGQSTRAFLVTPVQLRSYDIVLDPNVERLFEISRSVGNDHVYIEADDLKIELPEVDMIFIDTEHTYYQLVQELRRHGNKAQKYLAFHDTGEPCLTQLMPAIMEFLAWNPHWRVMYHTRECHGFTVLERRNS
jgi:hypothetical protein